MAFVGVVAPKDVFGDGYAMVLGKGGGGGRWLEGWSGVIDFIIKTTGCW